MSHVCRVSDWVGEGVPLSSSPRVLPPRLPGLPCSVPGPVGCSGTWMGQRGLTPALPSAGAFARPVRTAGERLHQALANQDLLPPQGIFLGGLKGHGVLSAPTPTPGETDVSTSWRSERHEAFPADAGAGLGLALGSGQPLCPGWSSCPLSWVSGPSQPFLSWHPGLVMAPQSGGSCGLFPSLQS